jgi:hypothetical protein
MAKQQPKKEMLLIKPHHFLDIIKLFGSGLEKFVPNLEYGHDFWKVGNEILENPNVQLELTLDNDAICIPCKFSNGSICTGVTSADSEEISKDAWNKLIDQRLFKILGLENGTKISALELCKLAKEKLTRENIFAVWKEKPIETTEKRANFLMRGIEKYLEKYT